MANLIDRRGFLKSTGSVALGIGLLGQAASDLCSAETAIQYAKGASNAEKFGWRLGCQAYTFNRYTLFEAIDKTASLGLKYIEAYPNQTFSKDRPQLKIDESLPADARRELKKKLADSGIKMVNYGVCTLSENESARRKVFDFAKEMGIETIVSEPHVSWFETLDKLCAEYSINLALHNHPRGGSIYWDPDSVLKACDGRSKRIGACADTGHWARSNLNPLESLKKLEGRIISLHFKDLNQMGTDAHDVPWGTGVCNARGMLAEIYRQKLKPVFSIEYEYNWTSSLPEIAQCVEFFDKTAGELAAGKNS
jgi:sugar phosphate isomerase/epimerase